jgi:hypothetical protein
VHGGSGCQRHTMTCRTRRDRPPSWPMTPTNRRSAIRDQPIGNTHRRIAMPVTATATASPPSHSRLRHRHRHRHSRSTAWSPPCAALRNLRWVHTAFGRGGVVTPHCSGMGRDIEDERRTVCKRPDRGGGITRAVPSAGHARATPRAARHAVPAPASTTAAANPQPDSRRAAPLRA